MASELPLRWEKLKVLSVAIASLAIPLVVAVLGSTYSKDQKDKEIGARYVELAVGILRSEPSPQSKALRSWAISVIDHYSQLPLSKEAKAELELQQLNVELQEVLHRYSEALKPLAEKAKKEHEEAMAKNPIPSLR